MSTVAVIARKRYHIVVNKSENVKNIGAQRPTGYVDSGFPSSIGPYIKHEISRLR